MRKYIALALLVFYGCSAQSGQNDPDVAIERQWGDSLFDISGLKDQYTSYCIESEYKIDNNDKKKLCELVAEDLIDSTVRRAVTLDQFIEITRCVSEDSYGEEDCLLGDEIKYRSIHDALVASLCKMEPTLVEDDYHGGLVRRGSKIYSQTSLIFECGQKWFVDDSSYSSFSVHTDKINYIGNPVLYESLSYGIYQDNEGEFLKQLESLSVSQLDSVGPRLLFDAVDVGNGFYLQKLLSFGVNANSSDDYFNQPLSEALSAGKDDAVVALLENGADPNVFDRSGNSGLYLAVENCPIATINKLLDLGAEVEGQLKNLSSVSTSPLSKAAEFGRKDVVMRLLEQGALSDAPQADTGYYSPSLLEQAARSGNEDIFNLLMDRGAKLPDNDMALIKSAIVGGNVNILKSLFSMGVELPEEDHGDILFKLSNSSSVYGQSNEYPYQKERKYQRADQLDLLVSQGLKLEYRENGAYDYITRLTSIYSRPSEVSDPFRRKYNAERLALTLTAIQIYSDAGLDLDYQESDETLLMDAASGEYLEVVELLLTLGADKNVATKSGKTAKSILGYSLGKTIKDHPEKHEKIEYLKRIYFLLDGKLEDLPPIEKRPPLSAENLLRSFLKR